MGLPYSRLKAHMLDVCPERWNGRGWECQQLVPSSPSSQGGKRAHVGFRSTQRTVRDRRSKNPSLAAVSRSASGGCPHADKKGASGMPFRVPVLRWRELPSPSKPLELTDRDDAVSMQRLEQVNSRSRAPSAVEAWPSPGYWGRTGPCGALLLLSEWPRASPRSLCYRWLCRKTNDPSKGIHPLRGADRQSRESRRWQRCCCGWHSRSGVCKWHWPRRGVDRSRQPAKEGQRIATLGPGARRDCSGNGG
eukprot:2323860-Amphidinium_carterae.1